MIIVRTPYRISFFGGGTDYPQWYKKNKGAVISTTINKYSYLVIRELLDLHKFNYLIRYYKREEAKKIDDIKHPVVREVIKLLTINKKLDITHHGDLPARTGMGTSSCFTVGLLHGLSAYNGHSIPKKELALKALNLEQKILKEPVGSQDQVAAAFGGFNKIDFGSNSEEFICNPLKLESRRREELNEWIQLFYTKKTRDSTKAAAEQIKNIPLNKKELNSLYQIVQEAEAVLYDKSSYSTYKFGELMHKQWLIKKKLANPVSNKLIDKYYKTGIQNGAIGGKVLGAGGGGFLLFITPPKNQKSVLKSLNLTQVEISFDYNGSEVVYKIDD